MHRPPLFEHQLTKDGSSTIRNTQLDTTYHSEHGALQESLHIYIRHGLHACQKSPIHILEIGFGTGLNTILTALETNTPIFYESLETHPLPLSVVQTLNYASVYPKFDTALFETLHTCNWNTPYTLTPTFHFTKRLMSVQTFPPTPLYDIIYFDAFGPTSQPELWEEPVLQNMYNCLNKNGILVTFCAKGSVKRTLKKIGFVVESLNGPPGKREITRARKCTNFTN